MIIKFHSRRRDCMRLGILGTGMIVADVLTFIHELPLEKVVLFARKESQEKAERLKETYGLDDVVYDYQTLLDSDVDTIYVALPNHCHYEFTKQALMHGKHVIVEKPITSRIDQLEELMSLAKEHHVMMMEAMNIHHLPAYQALRQEVKKLGAIKMVSFNFSQYSSRYDRFKQGDIAPVFDVTKAGGALMDLGVYNLHAIIGLFGAPQAVHYEPNIECHIDTSGVCVLDYGTFKALSIACKDCSAPVHNVIQSDDGSLVFHTPASVLSCFDRYSKSGEIKTFDVAMDHHRLYYEFMEFIRIIQEKDRLAMEQLWELSWKVTKILEEARSQVEIPV